MTFNIKKNNQIARVALRRLGYAPYTNRQGKESFVRRLRSTEFPRFHLYVNEETGDRLICSLHLDQRAPMYQGSTAHGGDYDSPEVVSEITRLQSA